MNKNIYIRSDGQRRQWQPTPVLLPGTEEPRRLQSLGSLRVGHDWNDLAAAAAQMFSHVWLFVTLWTVVCQAPLSIGFSRPDYWNELAFPPPGDLLDPGVKHMSLISPPLAGGFFISEPYGKPIYISDPNIYIYIYVYVWAVSEITMLYIWNTVELYVNTNHSNNNKINQKCPFYKPLFSLISLHFRWKSSDHRMRKQ